MITGCGVCPKRHLAQLLMAVSGLWVLVFGFRKAYPGIAPRKSHKSRPVLDLFGPAPSPYHHTHHGEETKFYNGVSLGHFWCTHF